MYERVADLDGTTREYSKISDTLDAEMRDLSKKVQRFEARVEETMEALQASAATMEAAENSFNDIDDDVNAQTRRIMLLEEECFIQVRRGYIFTVCVPLHFDSGMRFLINILSPG